MFSPILFILLAIAVVLCVAEFFLTRARWALGIILPVVVFLVALWIDLILLWLVAALLVVFVVALLLRYRQEKKQRELDQMNRHDL